MGSKGGPAIADQTDAACHRRKVNRFPARPLDSFGRALGGDRLRLLRRCTGTNTLLCFNLRARGRGDT